MRVVPSVDNLSATWRLLIVGAGMVLMLSVGALPWPVTSNTGVLIILATIALVAGLFDATIAGALQSRIAGGWGLVPEALLGVLLGFAVLLYPHVPLDAIAMLLSVWMLARGIMLLTVGRGAASDPLTLTLALGGQPSACSRQRPCQFHWGEATIFSIDTLIAYVVIWSAVELSIGLNLRSRVRRLQTG